MAILEKDNSFSLSAKELARQLQISEKTVLNILEKKNLSLGCRLKWEFKGAGEMAFWNPPLACIYLSAGFCFFLVGTHPCRDSSLEGVFRTGSEALGKKLGSLSLALPLDMEGCLLQAIHFAKENVIIEDGQENAKKDAKKILLEAIAQWEGCPGEEFYLFTAGDSFDISEMEKGCFFVSSHSSLPEMEKVFLDWIQPKCSLCQYHEAKSLTDHIKRLWETMEESSCPFAWMLRKKEKGITGEAKGGGRAPSLPSIEDYLGNLLPGKAGAAGQLEMGALIYMRDEEGRLFYRLVPGDEALPCLRDFHLHSRDAFLQDMELLKEETRVFADQVWREERGLYLTALKSLEKKGCRKVAESEGEGARKS